MAPCAGSRGPTSNRTMADGGRVVHGDGRLGATLEWAGHGMSASAGNAAQPGCARTVADSHLPRESGCARRASNAGGNATTNAAPSAGPTGSVRTAAVRRNAAGACARCASPGRAAINVGALHVCAPRAGAPHAGRPRQGDSGVRSVAHSSGSTCGGGTAPGATPPQPRENILLVFASVFACQHASTLVCCQWKEATGGGGC